MPPVRVRNAGQGVTFSRPPQADPNELVSIRMTVGERLGVFVRTHSLLSARPFADTLQIAFAATRHGIATGLLDDSEWMLFEDSKPRSVETKIAPDLLARIMESSESMPPQGRSGVVALATGRLSPRSGALRRYAFEGLRLLEQHPELDPNFEKIRAMRRAIID